MAIFHLHVKNISRGDGRSAIAAAAYRAGETLVNEAEERASAFGGRRDVVFTRIMLPAGAPIWMTDRAKLWNAVEAAERRKDARLAKEIEFAIPRELPRDGWAALVCAFAGSFVALGHAVDIAIHDDPEHKNPHAHLMLTTRTVGPKGFGLKIRDSDAKAFVHAARRQWAGAANAALSAAGLTVAIDPRSHADRRLDKLPGQHRGPSREERQAKRREIDMHGELEPLSLTAADDDVAAGRPVPDLDGRPISVDQLDAAEQAMLAEHTAENAVMAPDPAAQTAGERESAEAAVAEINAAAVSDDDAARYRLEAPTPPSEPGSRPGPSYWSTFDRMAAEPSAHQGEPTYWRSIENRDRPPADDEPNRQ
jgi:ATP-dependent exoDNAse (exonuclease V) alpha subunit